MIQLGDVWGAKEVPRCTMGAVTKALRRRQKFRNDAVKSENLHDIKIVSAAFLHKMENSEKRFSEKMPSDENVQFKCYRI